MQLKPRVGQNWLFLGFLLSAGCLANPPADPDSGAPPGAGAPSASAGPESFPFADVTPESGVSFVNRNGEEARRYTMVESLGGGLSALDFDGDARLDLFFAGGGHFEGRRILGWPAGLFWNQGGWRFQDVSALAGNGFPADRYTHGCFGGDYDNDGFADVLLTGYGGLQLWHNAGDGTFSECHAAAGLDDALWSTSAAWLDVDGDGYLDLYVAHYLNWSFDNDPYCPGPGPDKREICPPREFEPVPDVFYFNNGDGTFREASAEVGVNPRGNGLGVVAGDLDLDGDTDVYVANDRTDNFLYLNDGRGELDEQGLDRGAATDDIGVANGSMGVDLLDYNDDGWPDIWVANYERESFALYRNEQNGQFVHVSKVTGISALRQVVVGFGTSGTDFDRDGDEDIVVACGHMLMFPTTSPRDQQLLVLENRGHRFERVLYPAGHYLATPHQAKGLVAADLDNDGDVDLAIAHTNQPAALLRNDIRRGQWLEVQLIGRQSNRDSIGARLTLHTSAGAHMRQIKGGGSYLSGNAYRAFWGIAEAENLQGLEVHWPSGRELRVPAPAANQKLTLVEPPR